MDSAIMTATVEKYVTAVSSDDLNTICEIYAEDATVEDPVGSTPHNGQQAIEAFYSRIQGIGIKLELTGPIRCAGKSAAFPFKAHMGDKTIEIIDVFEFNDDGKVSSMKAYWGF